MPRGADVLFEISGSSFAVPAAAIAEVLPVAELATPPGLPPVVLGFLDLADTIVPVLHAARLLDLADRQPGLDAHLLLLRGGSARVALLVDRVTAVRPTDANDWRPVAEDATFRGCVVAELAGLGRPVHGLSLERLISAAERAQVASFRDAELRRRAALEAPA